jgi:hypothetical protein
LERGSHDGPTNIPDANKANHMRLTTYIAAMAVIVSAGCREQPGEQQLPSDSVAAQPAPSTPSAPTTLAVLDSGAPTLQPTDQAGASFRAFRDSALQALSRQDTAFLYRILTPDIKNSFGGDDSIAGFKRIWRMNEGNSAVWSALSRVLRMGGQQHGDSLFIAPYVYAFWPNSMDAFEHVAVVTPNATVRDQPAQTAPEAGTVSHSILKAEAWKDTSDGNTTDSTWVRVSLPRGRTGWVRGMDVYSPVSWRAFFVKRNGRWQMQLFVAGD